LCMPSLLFPETGESIIGVAVDNNQG